MARKKVKSAALRAGGTAQKVDVLNINGSLYSLGDLRKADFSSLEDPSATVKSLVAWAKELNRILKGVPPAEITNPADLAAAAGVPDATSFAPVITALSGKGITENSTVGEAADAAMN